MKESSNYNVLIQKLDRFIRKYYINKILRGSLITISLCLVLFLFYAAAEHQFYFSQAIRKGLFFSYILIFLGSLGFWVLWPLAKYFNLGTLISHEQAARILGDHFEDVEDKLLNILQLKRNASGAEQRELIEASINQKAEKIRLIPFRQAIDLRGNRKYLRYALPPFLLLLFILFAAPSLLKDGTYRIINNNKDFERAAPYVFVLPDEKLSVLEFEDYTLDVHIQGEVMPDEVFITIDNYEYRMSKKTADHYIYTFPNVRDNHRFNVYSGRYRSETKTLTVLPKPKIIDFYLTADYPNYTGRRTETFANNGDLTVPEGTTLNWKFNVQSTDGVKMSFSDGDTELQPSGNSSFIHRKKMRRDESYRISLKNEYVSSGHELSYDIRLIKDQYPEITVESFKDSLEEDIFYFLGSVEDDYGLTQLHFVYDKIGEDGAILDQGHRIIPFNIGTYASYDYILDVNEYSLQPGEKVNYYFEVFDNDAVNGSKSSKTSILSYQRKSLEEVKKEEQANEEEIKDKLEANIDEARKIQEELQKLREKLLQKDQPDWQDKKDLENLLNRQKELQQRMEEAKNAHERNLQNQKEFMNLSPEMQEKQERLMELFEEMVDDDMKQLMEQIQQLMDELNKEQSLQLMEEFRKDEEAMEKEMERLQELYKQLEVEKEMNEAMDKLNELAERLEELSEKTTQQETDNEEEETKESQENTNKDGQSEEEMENEQMKQEELKSEQKDINEEFEDLQEKMKDMLKKNDELQFPKPISDDTPEKLEDINEDLEDSQQQLEQQQNQNASESQKKASQKMKKMASGMQQQMQAGQQEQMQEDLETLRQLLENLVTLSFDQESLISQINRTVINTPRYTGLLQDQMKIKDDFKIVEDTLQALSKRQPNIESFVLEKVTEVKSNLSSSLDQLEDRKKPEANQSQRTTMKNLNDLALMLSETMEQMQQQMAGMMSGNQMCTNPGKSQGQGNKGRVPSDKIMEGQERMSDDLKKMIQNMKDGKGNSARDFANAAARQAALRKALEEMQKQQQEEGKGISDQLQQIIDQMDRQEIDLVNKQLDNEMLMRQQEILTRLLEAEKAQKEREFDEKRKSEEAEELQRQLPPSLQEYLKERKAQLEQYKYVSPELRPHYKRLVDEYYKKLKRA